MAQLGAASERGGQGSRRAGGAGAAIGALLFGLPACALAQTTVHCEPWHALSDRLGRTGRTVGVASTNRTMPTSSFVSAYGPPIGATTGVHVWHLLLSVSASESITGLEIGDHVWYGVSKDSTPLDLSANRRPFGSSTTDEGFFHYPTTELFASQFHQVSKRVDGIYAAGTQQIINDPLVRGWDDPRVPRTNGFEPLYVTNNKTTVLLKVELDLDEGTLRFSGFKGGSQALDSTSSFVRDDVDVEEVGLLNFSNFSN
jgi:hypothetical protein